MRGFRKFCLSLAMITIAVFTLTGCKKFDCSGYIQAMLDSIYKGNHTEYSKITKLSEDRLAENYEEGINAEIEKLIAYMNVSDSSSFVNEATRNKARELFKKVYTSANYTIGEADKKGNVVVTVTPINIFHQAKTELDAYVNDFYARNDKGEFSSMSDEDFYSAYILGVIEILNKYTDKIGYGDPQDITVRVKANSQNIYSITDEEFLALDELIIDYIQ